VKENSSKERIETISFRGNRKIWMKFVFTLKMKGEKRVWSVLKRLIKEYINEEN